MLSLQRTTRCLGRGQVAKGSVIQKTPRSCRTRLAATPAGGAVKSAPQRKSWETVEVVCSDGSVLSSAEVLAIASPYLEKRMLDEVDRLEKMIQEQREATVGEACKIWHEPLTLAMNDTRTRDWSMVLQHLYREPSSHNASLDDIKEILPLVQKMEMKNLLGSLDQIVADKLPEEFTSLFSVFPYIGQEMARKCMVEWLTAAAVYNLPKVKEACACRIWVLDKPAPKKGN